MVAAASSTPTMQNPASGISERAEERLVYRPRWQPLVLLSVGYRRNRARLCPIRRSHLPGHPYVRASRGARSQQFKVADKAVGRGCSQIY